MLGGYLVGRSGWHQRPHLRRSKYNKLFRAGRGKNKRPYSMKFYNSYRPLNKISNLGKRLEELIENNPEFARDMLGRIAVWGGCISAPNICPILKSVYFIYKDGKKFFEINESEIQDEDFELFCKMVSKRKITKDDVENFSPQTINMMARKAEYTTYIVDKLDRFNVPIKEKIAIKKSLLPVSLAMDYKGFLTDDELHSHSLKITPSLKINKNRLLSAFAYTLRNVDRMLYKELLLLVVRKYY